MPSIVVLDDEPALAKLISVILRGAGYEVHAFTRPTEALEALEQGLNAQAIVADVTMPVMSGHEFFERVRSIEVHRATPFIFLSALAERRDVREGMSLGADDYITKPFESQELLQALEVRLRRLEELRSLRRDEKESVARALGGAGMTWQGREIEWGSKKAAEFFFYLLEHPGGTTTWEAAEALWPDKDETRAASVFHTTLHRLRKTLIPEAVLSYNRRYSLNPELDLDYDVNLYFDASRRARDTQNLDTFEQAARLYQGPYLAGFDSEWCEERREALHAAQLGLLLDASQLAETQGDGRRAAWFAHLAVRHEPFADAAWSKLALLWERLGDTQRAARARDRELHWDD